MPTQNGSAIIAGAGGLIAQPSYGISLFSANLMGGSQSGLSGFNTRQIIPAGLYIDPAQPVSFPSFPASGVLGSTVGGSGMSPETSLASITVGGQSDPQGGTTAGLLVSQNNPATTSQILAGIASSTTGGNQGTVSCYLKPFGCNYAVLGLYDGVSTKQVYYDILNGAVVSSGASAAGCVQYPNGWWRIWWTLNAPGYGGNGAPYGLYLCLKTTNVANSAFGSTSNGIGFYFWRLESAVGALDT